MPKKHIELLRATAFHILSIRTRPCVHSFRFFPHSFLHRLREVASRDRAVVLLDPARAAPVVDPVRLHIHARVVRDPEVRADRAPVAALPGAVPVLAAEHLAAREVERPADVRVRAVVELGVVDRDVADAAVEVARVAGDGAAGADEGEEERGDREEGKGAEGGRRHGGGGGGGGWWWCFEVEVECERM
ncbi:hypothetical protein GY45DRAFT_1319867 [Cubamyces sp. BRFM 1775]|nr:hypothetical protein GY45DRAFT_1319867 [Cubamyces sp. BRFM 1775]